MKRTPRQAVVFGAIDLADALTGELHVSLDQLPDHFSFNEVAEAARKKPRLMHGRRAENMFEYVVASLGKAALIKKEDAGAVTSDDGEVQATDYFVALKDGSRYLVEVKNRRLKKDFQTPVEFNRRYLARLTRYADLKGYPLMIAIYWSNLRQWTINRASDITEPGGGIKVTFMEAFRKNLGPMFGDRLIMAIPPLKCRLWADPQRPREIGDDGMVHFTISKVSFHMGDEEIVDMKERELALYFMFHSKWMERGCIPHMEDGVLVCVEFESGPDEDETVAEQPMQSLGTLAGMISNYYNWLTVTEDREIVRLTPEVQPGSLASGLEEGYRGKVLKLWVFETLAEGHGTLNVT